MTKEELDELVKQMGGTFEERRAEEDAKKRAEQKKAAKEDFESSIRNDGVKILEHNDKNGKIAIYEHYGKYYLGECLTVTRESWEPNAYHPKPVTITEWSEAQDFKEITEEEINILFGLDSDGIKKEVDSARKIKKRENAKKNIEKRDTVKIPYNKALKIYSEEDGDLKIYELNGKYYIERRAKYGDPGFQYDYYSRPFVIREITEEEITAIFGLEDIDIKRRVKSAKIEQQEKKKQETISKIEKREKLEEIPNKEMAVEIYSKKR